MKSGTMRTKGLFADPNISDKAKEIMNRMEDLKEEMWNLKPGRVSEEKRIRLMNDFESCREQLRYECPELVPGDTSC